MNPLTRHLRRWPAVSLMLMLGLTLAAASDAPGGCWPAAPGVDPRSCPPDDPGYPGRWEFRGDIPPEIDVERMHPRERALGAIGFSLDQAWQLTIGRPEVVIAVLDSGIRWNHRDLTAQLYLNRGELPRPAGSETYDSNGDGTFNAADYAGDARVGDGNGNGRVDPQDLIRAFSDCKDDDGNGYIDDISGFDFFEGTHCGAPGDNDPADATDFGHGSGIASSAAAETNNGIGDPGVCPLCRVLPVRVGDSFVVDANRFAEGLVYAVDAGATVVASALGSYNNTPAARAAVDYAYENGVALIASAADEYSYHHNYPSLYNHALYVNSIRYDDNDWREATSFWGLNACTNFGARIWVAVPSRSCSSGATSRLSGIAGLVQSAALGSPTGLLHPEELYQILRSTTDDLDSSEPDWGAIRTPALEGFDQWTGYGRVNALKAVRAAAEGEVPPIVDLHGPRWFAVVSSRSSPQLEIHGSIRLPRAERVAWQLEYALGVEPREADYVRVAQGEIGEDRSGLLGVLDFARLPQPSGPAPRTREDRDRYSVTLRLRARDDRGRSAEARRSFFVFDDPDWMAGTPIDLDASGEAAPTLVDLDGDGDEEIVLATADGLIRIFEWTPGGMSVTRVSIDARETLRPGVLDRPERRGQTIVRGVSVGDVTGDGRVELVAVSRSGAVYVFNGSGERMPGFPRRIDSRSKPPASESQVVEEGVLSQPVLADLDGKAGLEILVSALDGQLHAWRGDGSPLAGFPVALTAEGEWAKLVSTPAVGDIDGDGRPEILVGTNRISRGLSGIFAVRAEGTLHEQGATLAGWSPFPLPALRPDLLPTIASGVLMTPALIDLDGDGDSEVLAYAVTGNAVLLLDQSAEGPRQLARLSLQPADEGELRGMSFLGGTGSPLLADSDGDGRVEIYAPLLPMRMLTLRAKPGAPLDVPLALGGWDLPIAGESPQALIPMRRGFPRRIEDLMIWTRPAAADVDGDGRQEILQGSGGYLLHAFDTGGGEAQGFPKFTGGWIFSQPAFGDLDGDGRGELVTVTREGYLFVWRMRERTIAVAP